MSGHQNATLEDTVYFWFAANDTSGSGDDGATPLFDVREAGAAASAAPLLSGTPSLLSHANYPAGCHEVAVAATAANGFAENDTFAVFCTLAVDSQNPSGFVGSCTLTPLATATALATVDSNVDAILVDTGTTLDGKIDTIDGIIDAILVDTGTTLPATLSTIAAYLDTEIAAILADTNELQGDWADGGRLDLILDAVLAMLDDPRTEPGQGAPAANADAMTKIDYLYKWVRNKKDNDGSTTNYYADDGTTVDQTQATTESGGTVTKGEIATGP